MNKKVQMLFHSGNCLNHKKPYPKECRLCIQYCPHGAINEKREIAYDKCSECGVCMAVCPSDGFVDREINHLGDYLLQDESVVLHCPMAKPKGYEIPCLGLFDRDLWTTMLVLSNNKEIKVLTGDCGKCDDRQACVASVAVLKDTLQNWGKQPNIRIDVSPFDQNTADSDIQQNHYAFYVQNKQGKSLRELGKSKVKSLLPAIEAEETYDIPKSRQWLEKTLGCHPDQKVPYKALKASDKCTSCGVCAKICPQQALTQVQQEGKVRLIIEPLLCVQCSRCVDICGPSNLRLEVTDISHRLLTGKILLSESVPKYCTQCGKQIFHNMEPRLCMPCAAKDPSLKGILY